MIRFFICFSLAFGTLSSLLAQGNVSEKVDPKVADLMKRFVDNNKSVTTIQGWRIQILATTDRQRMEEAVKNFQALYPSIPVDWVHVKPNYKVRAGAFTTKREAFATQYILKNDYPTAYLVQDSAIKPQELIK